MITILNDFACLLQQNKLFEIRMEHFIIKLMLYRIIGTGLPQWQSSTSVMTFQLFQRCHLIPNFQSAKSNAIHQNAMHAS